MAIRLHMNHDLSEEKQSVLHLMPCKIYGDESANVSTYFTPYIREVDDKVYNSSFRGYPLQGKKITLPSGYKGITFVEHKKPEVEHVERNLYFTGAFSHFTYWNYDKLPSKNDSLAAVMDWIDIAEALHSTES
ncbi:ribonuclease H2 subunit C [Bombus vancouverensis nearcticus]|uniref:Ribonuclease H2 subunit C n=1 Tax=Bombus bifarius TaxID=103933 RepID=A0A6P8MGX8_9HYME|nr:ribonuclease H2 subunit C [Bombus vancouverensis nearcticus]XP_033301935.1 ribonuclease H2 subunit C [Bombus bifarius]XP_050480037.1 ribonuclease H2 subunit C [Bombus huntii]XP_050480038.1 ribonuclease H2 subunit C [Bombus huntii]XP_050480039.1 ribonuclease H2 subunit C [Bombus huntii]